MRCPHCTYKTSEGSMTAHIAMAHSALRDEVVDSLPNEPETSPAATREAWMLRAVEAMRPLFAERGETIPPVQISIGWPGGRGNKQGVIGQCWAGTTTADGHPAVFISPVLRDPVEVLGTIMHECIHAAGHFHHRAEFANVARKLDPNIATHQGWARCWPTIPMTPELSERLHNLATNLGPFPHAQVRNSGGLLGIGPTGPTVQSTRMIKCWCPDCGYTVRTTRRWLNVATPACPMCDRSMEVEEK